MSDELNIRVTTRAVKEQVFKAAIRMMVMSGLQVMENRLGDTMTVTVTIPPESTDPHGDRLKKMWDAKSS